jgi:Ribonuclease G/E
LCRLFGIEYGKRRDGGTILDVIASRLEEATDEDDFKESICIFEKFEGGTGLDEFGGVSIKVAFRDGFEVLVQLVSEDWARRVVRREIGGRGGDIRDGSCFA